MYQNKQAFTLIELLVVVLIIGILSAIALPQYQKAVLKSRLATIKPLVRSIADAQRVFYIANGKYGHFDELDIDVGGEETSRIKHTFSWGYCRLEGIEDENLPKVICRVTYQSKGLRYQESFSNGTRMCVAEGSTDPTDVLNRVCQNETNRTEATGGGNNVGYLSYTYQ